MSKNFFEECLDVLNSASIPYKAKKTIEIYENYNSYSFEKIDLSIPEKPNRPNYNIVEPKNVSKRGIHSDEKKAALLHSLAHLEAWAIDLGIDICLRYYKNQLDTETKSIHFNINSDEKYVPLPKEFYIDWLKVAWDEARHFNMLTERMKDLGYEYGDFPVHEGLWGSADGTCNNLAGRLAIIHMVHEGRGLDTTPKTIQKFKSIQDKESAQLLTTILSEEITHVEAGVKWFKWIYMDQFKMSEEETKLMFIGMVRRYFRGNLKPPFNYEARDAAMFPRAWYEELAHEVGNVKVENQGKDVQEQVEDGKNNGYEDDLKDDQ